MTYHTYYAISSRSLQVYPSYESHSPPQTSPIVLGENIETRKRKNSSSTSESDESVSGDEKKLKFENKTITRNDDLKQKTHKKSKPRKDNKYLVLQTLVTVGFAMKTISLK